MPMYPPKRFQKTKRGRRARPEAAHRSTISRCRRSNRRCGRRLSCCRCGRRNRFVAHNLQQLLGGSGGGRGRSWLCIGVWVRSAGRAHRTAAPAAATVLDIAAQRDDDIGRRRPDNGPSSARGAQEIAIETARLFRRRVRYYHLKYNLDCYC